MSYKPSHKFPKARKRQVGDLFIDGYDIYRWEGTNGNTRTMFNLKTDEKVELHHNRVEFMTHVAEGEVISTGAEDFNIVSVSQSPGFDVTYTIGERPTEISQPAVQFCADLAERRAAAYGKPGERRNEHDPRLAAVKKIIRDAKLSALWVNADSDRTRAAHAVIHHNADLDITMLPDSLIEVAHGGRWVAVNLKEDPQQNDEPADAPDAAQDEDLVEWVSDVLEEMDEPDPLVKALDTAADAVLDDAGVPDLDADAALTDEELFQRAIEEDQERDQEWMQELEEENRRLADANLPPASDEELPPGEPQPLLEDTARYQKGDRLWTPAGREYRVVSVDRDFVRVKHESGEMYIPHAEMPSLLHEQPLLAAAVEPNWEDEVVRVSAELIRARQRIEQLEEEVARLHDESRDTEPLAPETVEAAAHASQEMARVDVIGWDDVKVESKILTPVDVFQPHRRTERDDEIARLRNEGWFVVYETASLVAPTNEVASMYHFVRLERRVEDDDPHSDGQPEHRDVLDLAADVLGDDDEPVELPDADIETETETDLAPAAMPVHLVDDARFPITAAIRARGLAAVMDEMDDAALAAFRSRRDVGAHHDAPMIISGEVSS